MRGNGSAGVKSSGSAMPHTDTTPNILIVDDSASMRRQLRAELEKISTLPTIVEVGDGGEVLEALDLMEFDVIFLDINMPVMDGLSCLEAMRDSQENTPVIMCTGEDDRTKIREARDLGASACIIKPVTAMKVLETITPFVRLDGLARPNPPQPDFRLTR
jgi:CheY-like chemotaxis protein